MHEVGKVVFQEWYISVLKGNIHGVTAGGPIPSTLCTHYSHYVPTRNSAVHWPVHIRDNVITPDMVELPRIYPHIIYYFWENAKLKFLPDIKTKIIRLNDVRLLMCETICASFSGDREGVAESSDTHIWGAEWIRVWGGDSETQLLLTFLIVLCSYSHVLHFLVLYFLYYITILPPFLFLLQASWSDDLVSSVIRTQQEVTELLSQVWTPTDTHSLVHIYNNLRLQYDSFYRLTISKGPLVFWMKDSLSVSDLL